jgi:hypothetical protein
VLDKSSEALTRYIEETRPLVKSPQFPKSACERFASWSRDEQYNWLTARFECLSDYLTLSDVLGFDFKVEPHQLLFDQFPQPQPGSGLALFELSTTFKKFMVLWSRGIFKTSSCIVAMVIFILNYPNIRMCFLTGGEMLAKRQLHKLKSCFEKPTEDFLFLFPEFCMRSLVRKNGTIEDVPVKMGNAHEFTVSARTKFTLAEPTFAISTARSVKAGSHFDLIFIDDLVNDQNFDSPELLEKCYQDYLHIVPVLNPGGFILMTGTPYSYGDTYERIQEQAKKEEKEIGHTVWKISIHSCYVWGCKNCPHSSVYHDYSTNILEPRCKKCACPGFESNGARGVLFPQTKTRDGLTIGWTSEFLEQQERELGNEMFSYQYLCTPLSSGSQIFTEALIAQQTYFDKKLTPNFPRMTMIVGDLAYSERAGRDYSVLLAVAVYMGQLWVYDCDFGNWDADAIAQHTVDFILKIRPHVLFFEKYPGHDATNTVILNRAQRVGLAKVPLMWLPASNRKNAKITRIGAVKGELVNRRIWLYAGMPGYAMMVTQLLKWPRLGRRDDFADCLGQTLVCPSGYGSEDAPRPEPTLNWLRRLNSTGPIDESYPDTGCGTGIVA